MDPVLSTAFRTGYERMAAWSDLLDDINVYPVTDADTGRNLRVSLIPLKSVQAEDIAERLLMSATGNSGNIAGAFFSKFVQLESCDKILKAAVAGKEAAWGALYDPKPGTMLDVFDALADALQSIDFQKRFSVTILTRIQNAVLSTSGLLDELRQADVVDSGALGMFLFFEGFFRSMTDRPDDWSDPYELFGTKLKISNHAAAPRSTGYCISSVIIPSSDMAASFDTLSGIGENVVAVSDGRRLKVHLHAPDESSARSSLSAMGDMLGWKCEKIECPESETADPAVDPDAVHIVTDAAGSLGTEVARSLGITLLDSYIVIEDQHLPESMVSADTLYGAMSRGVRVTTAQASLFERHQYYDYLTRRFSNLLYLCVGSAYTGNFEIASRWAAQQSNGGCFTVVDTGAASGRLGLVARSVAKYAATGRNPSEVVKYAHAVSSRCEEFIFLEQLKFLAAGGRISKTTRFFGDLLGMKPVIRPGPEGAQKAGVVKSQKAQIEFLLHRLRNGLNPETPIEVLLQYTDNRDRVVSEIQPRIQALLPSSRISVHPMSLTSGVHMGPGTWAAAFLPGLSE